jgi:hypothetical protein
MSDHMAAMRGGNSAILLDVSGSMDLRSGSRRRIDILAQVLHDILPDFPGCRLFVFDTTARGWSTTAPLPEPGGDTALHLALGLIADLGPERIAVVSDGQPNEPPTCLDIARSLRCHIATFFCGDEDDHGAIAFMRALAWCSADGFGSASVINLKKPQRLSAELRLLLTGPSR